MGGAEIELRILVLNCGSSSIKYQFVAMEEDRVMARGMVAKIGEPGSYIEHETERVRIRDDVTVPDHATGLDMLVRYLMNRDYGVIDDTSEVARGRAQGGPRRRDLCEINLDHRKCERED